MAHKQKTHHSDLSVLDRFIQALAFAGVCDVAIWSNLSLTALKAAAAKAQSTS